MSFLKNWGQARARKSRAIALCEQAVRASRKPDLYELGGVPDSFDGRFDCLLLHIWPIFRGLQGSPAADQLAQTLYDIVFKRLELSLRETGVGDLGVPRQVRRMMTAFYGRMEAYEAAAAAGTEAAFTEVLRRNLYGTCTDAGFVVPSGMCAYVRALATMPPVAATGDDALPVYPEPPAFLMQRSAA